MAGALGVVITTDVPVSGQHAQPVYVDDSLPIVGPSRAIVVTTGEVPQMGGPPLAVRLAPAGTPAIGPGMYVYVVAGGGSLASAAAVLESILDTYSDTKAGGAVIGSNSPSGALRRGTDTESILSTSNDRLHINGPVTAGWNRAGIGYGSYARANGLAFVAFLQDGDVQSASGGIPQHLAIGWFSGATPASALTDGNAIVIRENGTSAGKIERNGASQVPVVEIFKQLPLYVLVILRATGAVYYVGAVIGANELPAYPTVRPLGIDTVKTDATVYAAIWQRYVDSMQTNVYAVNVSQIAAWSNWYTAAIAADTLIGTGTISGRAAAIGGNWTAVSSNFNIGATGAVAPSTAECMAVINSGAAAGLIKCLFVTGGSAPSEADIIFRYQDSAHFWQLTFTVAAITLYKNNAGFVSQGASGAIVLAPNQTYTVQIIDDGTRIRLYLNQTEVVTAGGFSDTTFAAATSCGIKSNSTNGATFRDFEAHPRTLALPAALDLGTPYMTTGATSVATEDFAGGAADLNGSTTTTGALAWTKRSGTISRNGSGAGLVTTGTECLYTIPWSSTTFADISMDVTPPGTAYAQGAAGRFGPLFWQDADNWIAIRTFTDDSQANSAEYEVVGVLAGVPLSVQQRVNVATAIFPGIAATTRATTNGDSFYVTLAGVATLVWGMKDKSTAYSTLTINAVGLYAAAADTGSKVDNLTLRSA